MVQNSQRLMGVSIAFPLDRAELQGQWVFWAAEWRSYRVRTGRSSGILAGVKCKM